MQQSNEGKTCPRHGLAYVQRKAGRTKDGRQRYTWRCTECLCESESYIDQGLLTTWGMAYARGQLKAEVTK